MFWLIFQRLEPNLVKLYRKISQPPIPNLKGDRDIENSWIAANMPEGPGNALDFGCRSGWLGLLAARNGFKVSAVDLQFAKWFYSHPNLEFVHGDIFKLDLPSEYFDLIINCSAIEHVGLSGRYGIREPNPDGDIEAMALLKKALKSGKIMLLTIPVGREKVFKSLHRIYGEDRLLRLTQGWEMKKSEFWIKDHANRWNCVEESVALKEEPLAHYYGLGLFVLRKVMV